MNLAAALQRASLAWSAARQLGPGPLALYGLYRFGLQTGHYRRVTPAEGGKALPDSALRLDPVLALPPADRLAQVRGDRAAELDAEVDELARGLYRRYGGEPLPLELTPPAPLRHWTEYETGRAAWGVEDVKDIWEPARLGWAFTLARAAHTAPDSAAAGLCWRLIGEFTQSNPPNLGPNWASAQEVGLRILALAFTAGVLSANPETSPNTLRRLAEAIAAHAERIPPTLPYARSQQNNHLLSEAAGLYTAGVLLPGHPRAATWRALGWRWFHHGLQTQIAADGTYAQHSVNYHRLMLHLALWMQAVAARSGQNFPKVSRQRLAEATRWLLARLDALSGQVPNAGHNDGANILPLAAGGYGDYRPTAQAAARAFLERPALPPGAWDELSLWLGLPVEQPLTLLQPLPVSPALLRCGDAQAWGTLRAVHFTSRPAHSDQLHVDLWWHGQAVLLDAGTYRYNAAAPWENALAAAAAHNAPTLDEIEPMRRAGRFLWLDWAQAHVVENTPNRITAELDGYRRQMMTVRRTLERFSADRWQITDQVLPLEGATAQVHRAALHWLLPDLPWQLETGTLTLQAGRMRLVLRPACPNPGRTLQLQLVRAGQVLAGPPADLPTLGWYSPTYSVKTPALSLRVLVTTPLPLTLITTLELSDPTTPPPVSPLRRRIKSGQW